MLMCNFMNILDSMVLHTCTRIMENRSHFLDDIYKHNQISTFLLWKCYVLLMLAESGFMNNNFQHLWYNIQNVDGLFLPLTLYVLNFSAGTKTYIYIYVIPSHWHDTGNWNPSFSKTRTCLFHVAHIMAADDLAMQGARASAAMILT